MSHVTPGLLAGYHVSRSPPSAAAADAGRQGVTGLAWLVRAPCCETFGIGLHGDHPSWWHNIAIALQKNLLGIHNEKPSPSLP